MRLSIIALASLIICAVFASPILSGRGADDGLSLLRRDPTGKTTTKTTPKTSNKEPDTKKPTTNQPDTKKPTANQPDTKKPATKEPATKQTNGNTAKSCPNKKLSKRANADIIKAVDFAIAESSKTTGGSSRAGRGKTAKVYPTTFKNEPAFVKMVKEDEQGSKLEGVENEARCADAVEQFLGWAIKKGKDLDDDKKELPVYFIITKNMGDTQENWIKNDKTNTLKKADFVAVREDTVKDYKTKYDATNQDLDLLNGNNFVYKIDPFPFKKGEEFVVKGEIIDWEKGKLEGKNKDHPVPTAEIIEPDC